VSRWTVKWRPALDQEPSPHTHYTEASAAVMWQAQKAARDLCDMHGTGMCVIREHHADGHVDTWHFYPERLEDAS
jgi:hypothetical protein